MALNKVEICGVNTSKLPVLTNEEKDILFERIKKGRYGSQRIIYQGKFEAGAQYHQTLLRQQRKCR